VQPLGETLVYNVFDYPNRPGLFILRSERVSASFKRQIVSYHFLSWHEPMGTVIGLLPVTPSIDQFARIISNVAAPAFLLGAVASFISVVISRINRVIDRLHFIHSIPDDDVSRLHFRSDLPRLRRRAVLLNRSLFCSILAAITTALIIFGAFVSAFLHLRHEYGIALLFMAAMILFSVSLVDLARETRLALHEVDLYR
jgi:zinc transporter ZupT